MTGWVDAATAPLRESHGGVAIMIDPHRICGTTMDPSTYGEVRCAADLWQLRCQYEIEGRHRPVDSDRLVLVVTDPAVRSREQLPWDLARLPTAVLVAPVPAHAQSLVHALAGELADVAVREARVGKDPVAAVLHLGQREGARRCAAHLHRTLAT